MNIRQQFLFHFKDANEISTKEILEWYNENKSTKTHTFHTSIYQLIINPLINENKIKKISRGFYKITNEYILDSSNDFINAEKYEYTDVEDDELDEFDEYIKSKINNGG